MEYDSEDSLDDRPALFMRSGAAPSTSGEPLRSSQQSKSSAVSHQLRQAQQEYVESVGGSETSDDSSKGWVVKQQQHWHAGLEKEQKELARGDVTAARMRKTSMSASSSSDDERREFLNLQRKKREENAASEAGNRGGKRGKRGAGTTRRAGGKRSSARLDSADKMATTTAVNRDTNVRHAASMQTKRARNRIVASRSPSPPVVSPPRKRIARRRFEDEEEDGGDGGCVPIQSSPSSSQSPPLIPSRYRRPPLETRSMSSFVASSSSSSSSSPLPPPQVDMDATGDEADVVHERVGKRRMRSRVQPSARTSSMLTTSRRSPAPSQENAAGWPRVFGIPLQRRLGSDSLPPPFMVFDEGQEYPIRIAGRLVAFMRPYQLEGVLLMFKILKQHHGVVIADDDGLGKRFQVIAFLSALLQKNDEIFRAVSLASVRPFNLAVLVVCASVRGMDEWCIELERWAPIHVRKYTGSTRNLHLKAMFDGSRERAEVLLCTRDSVSKNAEILSGLVWDLIVLDSIQDCKNTKTAQFRAISALQSKYRIGIGSKLLDLQLEELYVAINLAVPDYINMTLAQFRQRFAGAKLTDGSKAELQTLLNKVVVRRQIENVADQLPRMRHAIVYCPLTGEQIEAYTKCLQEPEFAYFREGGLRSLMDGGESIVRGTLWDVQHWNPLTHRSDIKHTNPDCPDCMTQPMFSLISGICQHLSFVLPETTERENILRDKMEELTSRLIPDESVLDDVLMSGSSERYSGKLQALSALLHGFLGDARARVPAEDSPIFHKVAVFAQTDRAVAMLSKYLSNKQYEFEVVDGTRTVSQRHQCVDRFNSDDSTQILLASSKCFDPVSMKLPVASVCILWEPATSSSPDLSVAMARSQNVGVFHLLVRGTVDERLFRLQLETARRSGDSRGVNEEGGRDVNLIAEFSRHRNAFELWEGFASSPNPGAMDETSIQTNLLEACGEIVGDVSEISRRLSRQGIAIEALEVLSLPSLHLEALQDPTLQEVSGSGDHHLHEDDEAAVLDVARLIGRIDVSNKDELVAWGLRVLHMSPAERTAVLTEYRHQKAHGVT